MAPVSIKKTAKTQIFLLEEHQFLFKKLSFFILNFLEHDVSFDSDSWVLLEQLRSFFPFDSFYYFSSKWLFQVVLEKKFI